MDKIFYLSWFYKDELFHKDMNTYLKQGVVTDYLKGLYKNKERLIDEGISLCLREGASIITFADENYPKCFKNLERPPWVLTYKGNLELLSEPSKVSIVGSRRADPEVLYWLNQNLQALPKSTVLVSGGAIGVDQEVHKVAYRLKRRTICVLPVGITKIYPSSLKSLVQNFRKSSKGSILLLSQFYPAQTVFKSSFYPRNYVLSAISESLIVAQAERRSGTMVTAKYALEQGREIYTLPASPWDLRYSGNLKLLEDGAHQLMDLTLIQR